MAKKTPSKPSRPGKAAPAPRQAPSRKQTAAPARPTPAATGQMSVADRVVWACMHLLVILVPIAISNFSWIPGAQIPLTFDQFDIVKAVTMRGVLLIALGAWAWSVLVDGRHVRWHKIYWLILAFLAWVTLTTFTSISPMTALFGKYRRFEGLISFVTYAVGFFLIVQYAERGSRVRSLARSLFFGSLLVSLYGLLQYVGADPLHWGDLPFEPNRAFSTYGNPDLLGNYLVFPLLISIGLALSEEKPEWRVTYWIGFVLTTVVWIVAYVRGAWIGGFVGLAVFAFAAWRAKTRLTKVDWSIAGIGVLAAIGVIIRSATSQYEVTNFFKRVATIFQFSGGSGQTRTEIWTAALRAIHDRPILGFGADTFRLVFPQYKPVAYVRDAGYLSVADNVHDYPLQLTAGIGIPGFLLLYSVFGWVLAMSAKQAFSKDVGRERLVYSAFWCAALAYIVLLFFGLSVTGTTIFLWVSMGVLVAPFATKLESGRTAASWRMPVAALVAAVMLAGSVFNIRYVVADHYYLLARAGGTATVSPVDWVKKALAINPWNDMYLSELGVQYQAEMAQVDAQIQQAKQQGQDTKDLEAQMHQVLGLASGAYERAVHFVPREYDNYVFLANLYVQAGSTTGQRSLLLDALKWYRAGKAVEPYGPAIRFWGAYALNGLGHRDAALIELKSAYTMDPNYGEAYLFAGDIYKASGDIANAEKLYRLGLAHPGKNTVYSQAVQSLASIGISIPPSGQ